jgi:hypothetical protein
MARHPVVDQCTGDQVGGCDGTALDDADLNAMQKYAVITESLGSYQSLAMRHGCTPSVSRRTIGGGPSSIRRGAAQPN